MAKARAVTTTTVGGRGALAMVGMGLVIEYIERRK
jgi:hypothetical protein